MAEAEESMELDMAEVLMEQAPEEIESGDSGGEADSPAGETKIHAWTKPHGPVRFESRVHNLYLIR